VRKVGTKHGSYFFSFNPAISDEAAKRIRAQIRSWRLHLRSGSDLTDLAREINAVVRGWINYHGRFYPSSLVPSLNRINDYLVRWTVQKYKRYRRRRMRARDALGSAAALHPGSSPTGRLVSQGPHRSDRMMGAG
jgi:RNA-directed DNA polymerase